MKIERISAVTLTVASMRRPRGNQHKTRGRADRWPFLVRILHSLLHAGFTPALSVMAIFRQQRPDCRPTGQADFGSSLNYSDGLDGIRSLPRRSCFSSRIRLSSRTRALNFCKSCSLEAISASCFKRSSLSVIREKYSSGLQPRTSRRLLVITRCDGDVRN